MALNTPYKRVDLNVNPNYASMAQKDPWFALGYALGEGYWNNYNARGEKKATETAEQMLNNAVKHGDPNAGVLTNEDLIGKYARPDKKQQILDAALQLPELKYDKDGKEVKGTGNQQATIDKGLLKWGYLDDKYANSPNPVGDSAAAQKLVNSTELLLSNANMGAFDVQKFKLALDKQLMADGRNARQREAAWAAIQPMIAEKQAEHNAQVSNQLYDLYRQAQGMGDYASADSFLVELQKVNPNMAKVLADGRVTEKDRFRANEARELAIIRQGGRGSRSGSGSGAGADFFSSARGKYITSQLDKLETKISEGVELNDVERARYNDYTDEVNEALYGKPQQTQEASSKINYADPKVWIADGKAQVQAGKKTPADIINKAKEAKKAGLIDDKAYGEIVGAFPVLKARKKEDDPKAYEFMGRDVTKRSDWLNYLATLDLKDIAPLAKANSQ